MPQSPRKRSSSPPASARKGQGTTSPTMLKDLRHQVGPFYHFLLVLYEKLCYISLPLQSQVMTGVHSKVSRCTRLCVFVGDCADAHGPHVARGLLAGSQRTEAGGSRGKHPWPHLRPWRNSRGHGLSRDTPGRMAQVPFLTPIPCHRAQLLHPA